MEAFYFLTVLTLSFSICTSSHSTATFKMDISLASKSHFNCLKQRLCFFAIFMNHIVLFKFIFGLNQYYNVFRKLYSSKYITFGLNGS